MFNKEEILHLTDGKKPLYKIEIVFEMSLNNE